MKRCEVYAEFAQQWIEREMGKHGKQFARHSIEDVRDMLEDVREYMRELALTMHKHNVQVAKLGRDQSTSQQGVRVAKKGEEMRAKRRARRARKAGRATGGQEDDAPNPAESGQGGGATSQAAVPEGTWEVFVPKENAGE